MEEEIKVQDLIEHIRFGTQMKYDMKTYLIAIQDLIARNKELEEKYKRLSIEAQATAFDDDNKDTEGLLRVLLKQGEIFLDENGYYKRQDFNWEENMYMLGLMKKREKMFYIPDDECLDEYTKQLESQLKEYNEIKEIFKKYYMMDNETIYDGCIKMQDEIDDLKRQIKIKNAYLNLISDIAYDYDGCNTVKSLKELIDELVKMCNQAYKNDDWSVMFIGANNTNKNILQELLKDFEQTGNHIPHID